MFAKLKVRILFSFKSIPVVLKAICSRIHKGREK